MLLADLVPQYELRLTMEITDALSFHLVSSTHQFQYRLVTKLSLTSFAVIIFVDAGIATRNSVCALHLFVHYIL